MKKFAFLIFGLYLGLSIAPLSFAAAGDATTDWSENVCNFGSQYVAAHTEKEPGPESGFWDKLEEDLQKNETACGEINSVTQSLEKSDCNADGKVITEITEAFAGETSTDGGDNFVKTVYHGVCCLEPVTQDDGSTVCQESRDVYAETQDACEQLGGLACEERQWIIGTTGAGIIKIYVKQMYIWGTGIVGFVAVTIMVISGIQISFSGIAGSVDAARKRLAQCIGGIVLLFLSGLLLYTVNPTFFS